MTLYGFLLKEMKRSPVPLLAMATLGGLINALLLNSFSSISTAGKDGPDIHAVLLILLTMIFYYFTKKYTLTSSSDTMEEMINSIRKRVIAKLRHSDLESFERLDSSKIYNLLTQEVAVLSQSVNSLVNAFQASVIVLFCLAYIGVNSVAALATILLAFLLGSLSYLAIHRETNDLLKDMMKEDVAFFRTLGHILDGFKEIKLNAAKNRAVFRAYSAVVRRLKILNLKSGKLFSSHMVYTQTYFYLLIGIIVFVLPGYADIDSKTAMGVTLATLFMIAPLLLCLNAFPEISRANMAITNLYDMERTLNGICTTPVLSDQGQSFADFERIDLEDLSFQFKNTHPDEIPFRIGPINLEIRRGETLFIVGGNGSGKTTLLKLMTGLYKRDGGSIRIDQNTLDHKKLSGYRDLFGGVFADFHLFEKLYGLEDIDTQEVERLIKLMELEDKTSFSNGAFSEVRLSQGQRKRLGLIITLLEDKPIFIFDEWAADQDPHFKDYFYKTLLPDMKAKGKTLIVISHDDRYFDCADRVITMEEGRLRNHSHE